MRKGWTPPTNVTVRMGPAMEPDSADLHKLRLELFNTLDPLCDESLGFERLRAQHEYHMRIDPSYRAEQLAKSGQAC